MTNGSFILGPEGLGVTASERDFFRDADPWGFILFARNIDTPDQITRLTDDLRDAVGRDAPVLIDQEGGRVQRMRAPHWREWLPPLDQSAVASDPIRAMWLRNRIIAHELKAVGIDVNCSPTCDVARDDTHPFLRNRCLGTSAEDVTRLARACADGLTAGGVLPVMKHMPGHGLGKVDSHLGLPVADIPAEDARAIDFAPFKALADLPLGMSAHIVFPAFGAAPATQNPAIVDLIRRDIGFDGLLMTDDISMEALQGTLTDRAVRSIEAGCDLVLHCNGKLPEMVEIATASGRMTERAQARADAALVHRKASEPVDIAALDAELEALLA